MASTLRILRLFLRESHASRSNDERSSRNPARLISKADAFGNEKMITKSQFYQLALEANEGPANARDVLLNSMAAEIAAQGIPAEQGELVGREATPGADRGRFLHYWQGVQRKE